MDKTPFCRVIRQKEQLFVRSVVKTPCRSADPGELLAGEHFDGPQPANCCLQANLALVGRCHLANDGGPFTEFVAAHDHQGLFRGLRRDEGKKFAFVGNE